MSKKWVLARKVLALLVALLAGDHQKVSFNLIYCLYFSCLGHPPSGDFFALGSKTGARQSSPNVTGGPPAKRMHLEEEEGGGGSDLFSNPIRLAQVYRKIVGEKIIYLLGKGGRG